MGIGAKGIEHRAKRKRKNAGGMEPKAKIGAWSRALDAYSVFNNKLYIFQALSL
jgi:hypothetical protein